MVLILVLVVVSILSLATLTFSQLMQAEREATELAGRRVQARALARSGVDMTRLFLSQDETTLEEMGGWYDNPSQFQGVLVRDDTDPRWRGRFAMVAPYLEDGRFAGLRFGLEDESTKWNLNSLAASGDTGREILMTLPGMTDEIADAVLDWIDDDDETREFGAEVDYYSALDPPYRPKNGPLDTLDELLLVRDVTPWLLFGVDANRNGYADGTEPDGEVIGEVDNSDGAMDRGWSAYLTVHEFTSNLGPEGEEKINLNGDDLEKLQKSLEDALDRQQATFIVALRQNGPYTGGEPGANVPAGDLQLAGQPKYKLTSVLDLVGARVQAQFQGQQRPVVIKAPFPDDASAMAEYLPKLLDSVTTEDGPTLSGRININQASRTVMLGIPGISEETVDQIVASRESDPLEADESQRYPTWILTEGLVELEEMKDLMPYICAGGAVSHAQVVGYFDGGGPSCRAEVFFDGTQSPPAVLFWREISHLGRGYALATLGTETPDD